MFHNSPSHYYCIEKYPSIQILGYSGSFLKKYPENLTLVPRAGSREGVKIYFRKTSFLSVSRRNFSSKVSRRFSKGQKGLCKFDFACIFASSRYIMVPGGPKWVV